LLVNVTKIRRSKRSCALAHSNEKRHNAPTDFVWITPMLRHLICATLLTTLSASLARAQFTGPIPNTGYDTDYSWSAFPMYERSPTPEEVGRNYEIEMRYRETLRTKIPDRKPSNDPWKNVRPAAAASAFDRHRPQ
jgi:hypothetical protein